MVEESPWSSTLVPSFEKLSEKEEEIMELNSSVNKWRSANTDLKLIEEKVDQFLTELRHVIDQNRHNAKPWL